MVTMDATLLELNERATEVKNRVKGAVKDVERLRVERTAKEDELKRTQHLEEDRRWPELHDWCVTCHGSLLVCSRARRLRAGRRGRLERSRRADAGQVSATQGYQSPGEANNRTM